MPDVRFKDLCLDCADPATVGPWWAEVLDQELTLLDGGDARLEPPPGQGAERRLWLNRVPEPFDGSSRVQLGVSVAQPRARAQGWETRHDPEGVPCAFFGPRPGSPLGPYELITQACDPLALGTWWAERTGATVRTHADWVLLSGVAGMPWPLWVFSPESGPKAGKNRLHWDVTLDAATLVDLVGHGASVLAEQPGWTVLADPEGNEWCAFRPS